MADIIVPETRAIVTRAEAKAMAKRLYFTGRHCKNGHLTERRTSGGNCISCVSDWIAKNLAPDNERKRLQGWRDANPEKYRAQQIRSRAKNSESLRASVRRYKKNNPDITRANNQNRRAMKMANGSGVSRAEFSAILKSQKFRCAWCGTSIKKRAQMDHVKPLSKGGEHSIANIVGSCPTCNMRKSAKDPIQWAREIGKLI